MGRNLDFWGFAECALQGRVRPILEIAILRDYGELLGELDTEAVTEAGRNLDFWSDSGVLRLVKRGDSELGFTEWAQVDSDDRNSCFERGG